MPPVKVPENQIKFCEPNIRGKVNIRGNFRADGPQKKCAGKFLTGDVVAAAEVDPRELHEACDRAEVA